MTNAKEKKIIILNAPIQRGEKTFTEIQLIEPDAGGLRGLCLTELAQMGVTDLIKLLPRITEPKLTNHEACTLNVADLTQMGIVVAGFLLTKSEKEGTALAE